MSMKRAAPAVLLLAFVAGFAGGLLYTWVLEPIRTYEGEPQTLRTKDKYIYLALIGDLYYAEGDLSRAESRLAAIGIEANGQILADLIEAGTDIIDPVQTTADDMEPAGLKEDFGDRVVFHGAVDTQGVLPSASEEGVEQHVREILRVLGGKGGYIFAPCNAIQADTPPENVEAMYRAVQEYRPGADL